MINTIIIYKYRKCEDSSWFLASSLELDDLEDVGCCLLWLLVDDLLSRNDEFFISNKFFSFFTLNLLLAFSLKVLFVTPCVPCSM